MNREKQGPPTHRNPRPDSRTGRTWLWSTAVVVFLCVFSVHLVIDSRNPIPQQFAAIGAIVVSWFFVAWWIYRRTPKHDGWLGADRTAILAVGFVLTLPIVYLLVQRLGLMPIWSEEQGWLHHARLIAHLERVHPIVAKSDFPSSFQVYPIALLGWLEVPPLIASRITAIFYYSLGLLVFFLCLLRIEKETSYVGIRFGLVFALGSPMLVYYVLTGWHEITPVLPLAAFVFLCFLHAHFSRDEGAAVLFAAAAGFCFWTLYTPALWALILGTVFLVSVLKRRAFGIAMSFILAFLVIAAPCLGVICRNPEFILHRHIQFYLHAGEEAHLLVETGESRVERFASDFRRTVNHVLPRSGNLNFDVHGFVNLPWTTALSALFGIVMIVLFWRFLIVPVLVPSFLLLVGIVGSSPTYWRESILELPALFIAAIGVGYVFSLNLVRRFKFVVAAMAMILIAAQGFVFSKRLVGMSNAFIEREKREIPMACILDDIDRANLRHEVIGVPGDFPFDSLQALTFEKLSLQCYQPAAVVQGDVGEARVFFMRQPTLEKLRQEGSGRVELHPTKLECGTEQQWVRVEIRSVDGSS